MGRFSGSKSFLFFPVVQVIYEHVVIICLIAITVLRLWCDRNCLHCWIGKWVSTRRGVDGLVIGDLCKRIPILASNRVWESDQERRLNLWPFLLPPYLSTFKAEVARKRTAFYFHSDLQQCIMWGITIIVWSRAGLDWGWVGEVHGHDKVHTGWKVKFTEWRISVG